MPLQPYPKPKTFGGRLIRQAIASLRKAGLRLPLDSHILVAASGGRDSTALAHLLVTYGRRIVGSRGLSLLHVNHGWRGAESDADEDFVVELGRRLGVPAAIERARPEEYIKKGESLEDAARRLRIALFDQHARRRQAHVFVAQHQDDQAETILWRLLSGSKENQWVGIHAVAGVRVRPLLDCPREWIEHYLKEEGLTYRHDSSNDNPRFLRVRIRKELMPVVQKLFPRAVQSLIRIGLDASKKTQGSPLKTLASSPRKRSN